MLFSSSHEITAVKMPKLESQGCSFDDGVFKLNRSVFGSSSPWPTRSTQEVGLGPNLRMQCGTLMHFYHSRIGTYFCGILRSSCECLYSKSPDSTHNCPSMRDQLPHEMARGKGGGRESRHGGQWRASRKSPCCRRIKCDVLIERLRICCGKRWSQAISTLPL